MITLLPSNKAKSRYRFIFRRLQANKVLQSDLIFINHRQTYMIDNSYEQKLSQIRLKYKRSKPAHLSPRTTPLTPRRIAPTLPSHQTDFNLATPRHTHTSRDNCRTHDYYDQIDTHRHKQKGPRGYPAKGMAYQLRTNKRSPSYGMYSPAKSSYPQDYGRSAKNKASVPFYLPQNSTKTQNYSPLKEYSHNLLISSPSFKAVDAQEPKPAFFNNKSHQNDNYEYAVPLQTPYFQASHRTHETKKKATREGQQPCENGVSQERRSLSPAPHSFKNLTIDITEDKADPNASKQADNPIPFTQNIKNIDKIKQKIQAALIRNKHIK